MRYQQIDSFRICKASDYFDELGSSTWAPIDLIRRSAEYSIAWGKISDQALLN